MSRRPLVDADSVMRSTPGFKLESGVRVVYYQSMSAVLEDVVAKYEAALEKARIEEMTATMNGLGDAQNLRDSLDVVHSCMDRLAARVATLERAQRERKGEL